jgi:hypothetical protein
VEKDKTNNYKKVNKIKKKGVVYYLMLLIRIEVFNEND